MQSVLEKNLIKAIAIGVFFGKPLKINLVFYNATL